MGDERGVNDIDRRLGQRVRVRRLEIGMSQERLAELLGVTFQQVQKYEKGVNRIAASRLVAIADALERPPASFFEGLGPDKTASPLEAALLTPEGRQLITVFASIQSASVRRQVLQLARALVDDASRAEAR